MATGSVVGGFGSNILSGSPLLSLAFGVERPSLTPFEPWMLPLASIILLLLFYALEVDMSKLRGAS